MNSASTEKKTDESCYVHFFSCLTDCGSPKDLELSVVRSVRMRQRKAAKFHLFFLAFVAGFSCTGIFYAISYIGESFSKSGFYHYLSLLLSGDATFLVFWKEILFSIIESLPLFTIAAFLAATALFLWSLMRVTENADVVIANRSRRIA